jgi:hypothetical protein
MPGSLGGVSEAIRLGIAAYIVQADPNEAPQGRACLMHGEWCEVSTRTGPPTPPPPPNHHGYIHMS